jgi:hypothetical protein
VSRQLLPNKVTLVAAVVKAIQNQLSALPIPCQSGNAIGNRRPEPGNIAHGAFDFFLQYIGVIIFDHYIFFSLLIEDHAFGYGISGNDVLIVIRRHLPSTLPWK